MIFSSIQLGSLAEYCNDVVVSLFLSPRLRQTRQMFAFLLPLLGYVCFSLLLKPSHGYSLILLRPLTKDVWRRVPRLSGCHFPESPPR